MTSQPNPLRGVFRGAALALTILSFAIANGNAQSAGPFGPLAGSWSGSGTINLANGKHEPIKCRASYDVLDEQNKLGSATYSGGAIMGNWSESTRNAAGTMSGKVEGAGFQVVAKGPTFTANLNLMTRGDKQSVTIRSQDAQAEVQGATINLQRG